MTDRDPTDVQPLVKAASTGTPWETAQQQLAKAPYYWLATTRPNGRPHVRPLLAVWLADALYFCTGSTTQKGANLRESPQCTIATGTDAFHFVVEGEATKLSDETTLDVVATEYATKYEWEVDVRDGALYADGAPTAGPPPYELYELLPMTVYGFSLDESGTATRWQFE